MKLNLTLLTLATLLTTSIGAPSIFAQACTPAGADIAAWWDGDSVAAGTAYDLTGQNDLLGTVGVAGAVVGNGLYFDGTGANSLSLGGPLLDSLQPMTIECWITLDPSSSGSTSTIIAEVGTETGSPEGQYALRVLTSGVVQFLRKTGAAAQTCTIATSSNPVPVGIPTHVVAMWGQGNLNDNNIEVWVNNVRSGYTNDSHFTVPVPFETRVGETANGTFPFHGSIDELIVHKRALHDSEIAASFFASINGHCKDCTPRESQLAHHWTGDSICDSFVLDDEGGAALGSIGSYLAVDGIKGTALGFSGTNWYRADGPVLSTTGSFTTECWFRSDTTSETNAIFSEFGNGAAIEGQWALRVQPDESLTFWRLNGSTNCSGSNPCAETFTTAVGVVTPGMWHHVAATYSSANDVELYLDGSVVSTSNATSHVALTSNIDLQIGAYNGGNQFNGAIDEVSLFRRELAPTEISARYAAGRFGVCDTTSPLPCHLGDDFDYGVMTRVNGTLHPNAMQKVARAGDVLSVTMISPGNTHVGGVPVLALDVLGSDTDVPSYPGAPGLHLTSSTLLLFNGLKPTPLGFTLLPPGGIQFDYMIPNGLQGTMARFQSVIYSPVRVIGNVHDIEFR